MNGPRLPRRLLAGLLLAFLIVSPAGPASAQDAGHDNAAVAVNTKDGSSLFEFAFSITHLMGETVDPTNAAVAWASCTECQTVAVAIQIVFVMDDASTIVPENIAIAVNELCTLCETMASAYQFVITTDGPVRFTEEGLLRLAEIRRAFLELGREIEDMTLDEIDAAIDALVDQIADVLATEVVPAGEPVPDASPTPAPTDPSPTPEPTVSTASPEPTETATTTPSPEPSVTVP